MPGTSSSSDPGIAAAVARPPSGRMTRSRSPWITSVGHVEPTEVGGAVALADAGRELA